MTTPISYPLVNGQRHSFASIELKIDGQVYIGFKSLNYTWTLEPTAIYGNHPDPIGETVGQAKYEGDMELWLAEWNQLQKQLGPSGFALRKFDIVVTYSENGFDTLQDELLGCRIKSVEASQSSGPDGLSRKCSLYIGKILIDSDDQLAIPLQGTP